MTMTAQPLTPATADPYDEFVQNMPDTVRVDLELSETPRSALKGALSAGWSLDALIADAKAAYRSGGGTGAVITRFRTLATRPARAEAERSDLPMEARHGWRPDEDGMYCKCGLPRRNQRHRI